MPSREEHLADVTARLDAAGLGISGGVHKSRVVKFDDKTLPVICVYGTEEDAEPRGDGWLLTHTFKIDIAVLADDGFDAVSGPVLAAVKTALLADPDWLSRWSRLPSFRVVQFGEEKATRSVAIESLVLRCVDLEVTQYPPSPAAAPEIEGVDVDVDVADPSPDGEVDFQITENNPETEE